jgi:hypothetical protein
MLIYLGPLAAIILAWLALAILPLARSRQWNAPSTIWTIAAVAALLGSIVGLVAGSLSGNNVVTYFGTEVVGGLVGGGIGAAVGAGATSAGKWSGLLVKIAFSILYWIFAIITSGIWLMINMLGDCFDNQACIHHHEQALPQTAWMLAFYFAVFVVLLSVFIMRARQRGR